MAFNTKLYSAILLMLVLLLVVIMEESSGCHTERKCFYAKAAPPEVIRNRKILVVFSKDGLRRSRSTGNGEDLTGRDQLRGVPSGPDPLHHNGGTPKKPRTP